MGCSWCQDGWGPPGCPDHDADYASRDRVISSPTCNCGRMGGWHSYTLLLCPPLGRD